MNKLSIIPHLSQSFQYILIYYLIFKWDISAPTEDMKTMIIHKNFRIGISGEVSMKQKQSVSCVKNLYIFKSLFHFNL